MGMKLSNLINIIVISLKYLLIYILNFKHNIFIIIPYHG